ncbi:MAG: D-alanine--D-alanine ligase A [Acidobacteria bacterium RIFCSPLOWO2_02_FULL_61_28]|nr:MAG: D-alanine--D-alanine ligase A [Acidobacteria bacterium RIFCSPLOWO2_02_FULL_61_28]
MKKLRVAVLFGGRSAEHEVSLQSARNVIAAADPRKYEIVPIEITKEGRWRAGIRPEFVRGAGDGKRVIVKSQEVILAPTPAVPAPLVLTKRLDSARSIGRLDVIFPVLHGTFGEDGTIQGLLELAGIPYVGAGVLGSAAGMDKEVMKRLFRERGLPIVPYLTVRREEFEAAPRRTCLAVEKKFRYPVFVKPANLGSSVGISKARNRRELAAALRTAADYDRKILVEKAIAGREIECSVLGNDDPIASVPGEVIPGSEFYDYADKYLEDSAKLIVPAPLRPAQTREVQRLAVEAFRAIDCAGMARVDFFLEKRTGKIYVNEINTIPGFTAISMYPRMWEASGLPYAKLIDRLIELALERHREKTRTRYSLR